MISQSASLKAIWILVSIMLLGESMAAASIMHVVDPKDPNAFPDIQQAIDAALDGDEIMVMPGTYTSNGAAVVQINNKELTLFSWGGPELTRIDGQNERRGIFCNSGISGSTLISGFTIMQGLDDELGGGGMYLVESEAIINDCHFHANHAIYEGGAVKSIAQNGDGPVFNQCQFTENGVEHWLGAGGAVYMDGNGEFLDSDFTLNSSAFGGAVYSAFGERLPIRSSNFSENTSSDYGGALRAYESTLDIHQCSFDRNSQGDEAWGGGAIATERCDGLVTFCTFDMNSSGGINGGAILLAESSPRFENCEFNNNGISQFSPNLKNSQGGAIHAQGGAPRFWDCRFDTNLAGSGGTISIDTGTLEVRGTQILNGLAAIENGGGIKATNIDSLVLHDCIFRNNSSLGSGSGAALSSTNVVLATNCTFDENHNVNFAGGHVGLEGIHTGSRFENCDFTNGRAYEKGAGMQTSNIGALTLIDCNFMDNLISEFSTNSPSGAGLNIQSVPDQSHPILIEGCEFSGNRICCDEAQFYQGYGGALHASGEHIDITFSRFFNNVALAGGSIFASATIRNCSVSGSASLIGGGGLYALDGTRVIDSRVRGGSDATGGAIYARNSLELEGVTIEHGAAEGLFVRKEEQHAGCFFGDESDVSIRDSVICDGVPRNIYGNHQDLGGNHITEHCCPGDFNHDGEVGSADLGQLLARWSNPALGTPADLNDDGTIDGADLALVLANWGGCN